MHFYPFVKMYFIRIYVNMDRIDQLKELLRENPGDPELQFMIALELKDQDPVRSKTILLDLIQHAPSYLPAYFITAELLFGLDETGKALEIVKAGIDLAIKSGNKKTLQELKNLEDEIDEG